MMPAKSGRGAGEGDPALPLQAWRETLKRLACVLLLVLSVADLTACQKRSQAPAAPAAASALPEAASHDGSPQIVTSTDSVHIEYRVYGAAEPAVVLVHGWACSSAYWREQIEPLRAKYTVVVLNLGGHGASGRNRSEWSMERYGQDVASVVQAIPNRQIVLVGHSMGAVASLEAAPAIGPRLLGLIAVDSLQSIGEPPLPHQVIERQLAPLRENFVGATRELVSSRMFTGGADPRLVQKVAYDLSLASPRVAIASMESLLSWNPGPILLAVHVPVLAINSDLTPTDEARIGKYLPGFHADVLPHTGHFLMMEAPQRFNPVLLKDIDTLVQRAHRP
jgi:pimeloyl-ACP methyl ester carboxylesterase